MAKKFQELRDKMTPSAKERSKELVIKYRKLITKGSKKAVKE